MLLCCPIVVLVSLWLSKSDGTYLVDVAVIHESERARGEFGSHLEAMPVSESEPGTSRSPSNKEFALSDNFTARIPPVVHLNAPMAMYRLATERNRYTYCIRTVISL